ncbi:YihY/virulence factor BrkB family protein [Pseudonocardia endophytica]|uniref:Membrane protein n=1 Tax=Pseudonocardia endophytica TaxID=401976 RepID=A0A4R1HKM9_PSEEN|nr:YihY/virulence factor BrkB family protein [Pseudonocardia endophytica]TCK22964.1 membrane protein [Pseudonocardia endophytica]
MSDVSEGAPTVAEPSGARAGATVKRTLVRAWDDNIFSESAAAAFWQTLSLPPLLLGLLGSLGYVGSWFAPNTLDLVRDEILHVADGVFSGDAVHEVIAPTVDSILTTGRSELVSLGFVISLWSGSSAMSSFVDAITRAHDQYGVRNPIWQRTLALLLYVVGLVVGIVALPLLALGPDRITRLLPGAWQDDVTSLIGWMYYPVLGVGLVLALTTLYRLALPAKPPWRRGLPGALLAAVVFLVGVTGLRVYLSAITTTGYTYGALAAPIAFLLAAFFIGFAVVIGAHLNASIQHFHPMPLKDRRGVVEQPPPRETGTVRLPSDEPVPGGTAAQDAPPGTTAPAPEPPATSPQDAPSGGATRRLPATPSPRPTGS